VRVGAWFGVIGMVISVAILLAQSRYLKKTWQVGPALRRGAPTGLLAGFLAGGIAQLLYYYIGPTEFLRVICWGIGGGLMGVGLSLRIPNLGRRNGLLGGAVGGALGGIGFIILAYTAGDVAGRLLGIAVIGFFIGLMLVLIEAISRKYWLDVVYSTREVVSVNLGAEPVLIGSSSEVCTVFVRDAPPVAFEFTLEAEKIRVKHVNSGEVFPVQPGERMKLAAVELKFRTPEVGRSG
jgi:hypothetical protein